MRDPSSSSDVRQRLSVSELTAHLRKVANLIRRSNLDPAIFNAYKRHFQINGFVDIESLPQAPSSLARQTAPLEKLYSGPKEPYIAPSSTSALIIQDVIAVGYFENLGNLYLHTAIHTPTRAFGLLHNTEQLEASVALLHNEVLPFYRGRNIRVAIVQTDYGYRFCGAQLHPYELYLQLCGITHQRPAVTQQLRYKGGIDQLQGSVLNWLDLIFQQTHYHSLGELQHDLDRWLESFNTRGNRY